MWSLLYLWSFKMRIINQTIFADREDAHTVVEGVRFSWLRFVLESTGMNLEGCFPDNDDPNSMTIAQKAQLREILKQNKILLLDDHDGGVRLYIDEDLIAEWRKPRYRLNIDHRKLDPKKKSFASIDIEYWSVFDEQETQ